MKLGFAAAWSVLLACSSCAPYCGSYHGDPKDYPDFETTLTNWRSNIQSCDDEEASEYLVLLECQKDNVRAVSRGNEFTSMTYYFDSGGEFLALEEVWDRDIGTASCNGWNSWPVWIDCTHGVVAEVVCQGSFHMEAGEEW